MDCFKFILPLSYTGTKIVFFSVNMLLMVCSVLGNGLVIYLIISRRRLHLPTYYLILALASSDFITALCGQLSYCIEVAFKNGTTSCITDRIIAVVNASSCSTSLLLLCMIARDRYLHVSKGLRYSEHTSAKQVIIICISCWLVGMSIASLFVSGNRYVKMASTLCFALLGILCFTFICVISRKVHCIVLSHFHARERSLEDQTSEAIDDFQKRNKFSRDRLCVERTVNRSIFAVVILYSIAWFPVISLMIMFTVFNIIEGPIPNRLRYAFIWSSTVSYVNGAVNPFIYAYRCDIIGREIKQFIFRSKLRSMFQTHIIHPLEFSNNETFESIRN